MQFEIAIGFFVDGNLQENRSFTNYHNVTQSRFNFINFYTLRIIALCI